MSIPMSSLPRERTCMVIQDAPVEYEVGKWTSTDETAKADNTNTESCDMRLEDRSSRDDTTIIIVIVMIIRKSGKLLMTARTIWCVRSLYSVIQRLQTIENVIAIRL